MSSFSAPKGVAEYLPPRSRAFAHIRQTLETAADRAGYGPIELSVFEHTEVFTRGIGASTDVVSKEMYTFDDRGGRSLSLRPEGTAGVVRAVIENGLDRGALPVKLRYAGEFFRAERPQAGRYRQFSQVGVEAIGTDDPAVDAEVIAIADEGFRALGLTGYRLDLTSLGDAQCRPEYRSLLQSFLAGLPLDAETRTRAEINPLRVLDDKRPSVQALLADAPLMADHLCDDCRAHFESVREMLHALEIPYVLNPRMVRGLDYYTRTTFEFVHPELGAQSGMGGGGRYDGLMAELGGQSLSGIGFGLGVDRTLLALEQESIERGVTIEPGLLSRCDIYGVAMGNEASAQLAELTGRLRRAGFRVDRSFGGRGLKAAMKSADASGARLALVVGDRELESKTVQVKDLVSGDQQPVSVDDLVTAVRVLLLPAS